MYRWLHCLWIIFAVLSAAAAAGKGNENAAATRLLKEARNARASWTKFPGFSAEISVNDNGKITPGSLKVDSSGSVTLTGFRAKDLKSRVRRQLSSLVFHRLSNSSARNTPCAFFDANANHPLGRKIRVLNDELHSSYRIRDRQIIEVNRQMKSTRFTITVLKNYETPEKKFLPASYVVNVWNLQSNQLVSSTSHYNRWKKVGKYDLPEMVMIVTAKAGAAANDGVATALQPQTLDALTIEFSNHRLSK